MKPKVYFAQQVFFSDGQWRMEADVRSLDFDHTGRLVRAIVESDPTNDAGLATVKTFHETGNIQPMTIVF
jgi:hypothetical protein